MPQSFPICISITAHERVDVIAEQIRNIFRHCRNPLVILHVNAALRAHLEDRPDEMEIFRTIGAQPNVLVNPQHLETRWAHMFHAHIANLNLLVARGIDYGHVVLASSGDLFFRHGCEDHIAQYDAGVLTDAARADGYWAPQWQKDPVLAALARSAGLAGPRKSFHEGTYYRRAIVETMLRALNAAVPDWNYDDRYPKEELFFPTMLNQFADLKISPPLSYICGFSPSQDAPMIAAILTRYGTAVLDGSPLLRDWARSVLEESDAEPPGGIFMVSRVPRNLGNLARRLLPCLSEPVFDEKFLGALRDLKPADLLDLEFPGRTNMPVRVSAFLSEALEDGAEPLIEPGAIAAAEVQLAACPTGFCAPTLLDARGGSLSLAGAGLPRDAQVEFLPMPEGTEIRQSDWDIGNVADRKHPSYVFLFGALPRISAALVFLLDTDIDVEFQMVLEHHDGDKKRAFHAERGILESGMLLFRPPSDFPQYLSDSDGSWNFYLTLHESRSFLLRSLQIVR